MNPEEFEQHNKTIIEKMMADQTFRQLSHDWLVASLKHEYSYHFSWMGVPIIQYPTDILVLQELLWKLQPDLVIETGVARGGSVIFYAAMQTMMGISDGQVLGIDIDIRAHNRAVIEAHPMSKRIRLLEGSSIDPQILEQVTQLAATHRTVLVVLDSLHTHEHVLQELKLYSPLVKKDGYVVVLDTLIEDMPEGTYGNRPWGIANNPKTAVQEFLRDNSRFEVDTYWTGKTLVTVAHEGFLKCVQD